MYWISQGTDLTTMTHFKTRCLTLGSVAQCDTEDPVLNYQSLGIPKIIIIILRSKRLGVNYLVYSFINLKRNK